MLFKTRITIMQHRDFEIFQNILQKNTYTIVFFEGKNCQVCHALLPKIQAIVESDFPGTPLEIVNTDANPDIAGQYIVFTLPLILVFKQGREVVRIGGKNPIHEIKEKLKQTIVTINDEEANPYESLFSGLGDV